MNDQSLVLLNPPGDKKYIRDYFCAKVAKSYYYYHPTDLLYLSGTLSKKVDVHFIDAIAERSSPSNVIERIKSINPDWILFLTAGISYERDMKFIGKLHASIPNSRIIGTGDIYREIGDLGLSNYPFIDAIVLDFSTDDVLTYLSGDLSKSIPNIIHRDGSGIRNGGEVHGNGRFHVPMPRWDLVNLDLYQYPFERRRQFASMLTDFGCPYSCSFCPLSTVGFKLRDLDEVKKELKYLKSRGVNDIYFRDQTFGVNKKRTLELCDILAEMKFGWTCFTRVDVLTKDILRAMKHAGCHTVMFGIETTNDDLLHVYKKYTKQIQVEQAISLCREFKVDVVGFFIIGLPGETRESTLKSIDFACHSGIDFASFNIATPRLGTTLRTEAIADGTAIANDLEVDSSNDTPQWQGQDLSNIEIVSLQKTAFRRFYLRPGYLLKRLSRLTSFHQFISFGREGISLFRQKVIN